MARHQRTRPLATGFEIENRRCGTSNSEDPDQLAGISWSACSATTRAVSGLTRSAEIVYRFEPSTAVPVMRHQAGNPRSLIDDFVIAAYEDTRGMLWVGTERGAQPHRSTKPDLSPGEPPFNRGVRSIAEDRTGSLWFGTRGDGLARVDPRTAVRPARIGTPHPPAAPATTTSPACWWII